MSYFPSNILHITIHNYNEVKIISTTLLCNKSIFIYYIMAYLILWDYLSNSLYGLVSFWSNQSTIVEPTHSDVYISEMLIEF